MPVQFEGEIPLCPIKAGVFSSNDFYNLNLISLLD